MLVIKKIIHVVLIFAFIGCHENGITVDKIELLPASLFLYDSAGYTGQLLTLENKNDTAQIIKIFIKKGESSNPLYNIKDTITKLNYSIKEVFIYDIIQEKFKTMVICSDKKKEISFTISPVEAVEIARYFSVPLLIDKRLINKLSFKTL